MKSPPVRRIGTDRPWAPPRDFAVLARHFVPDGRWVVALRGVDYVRTDTLMRDHLSRWAREHGWAVETSTIRDLDDLDQIYLGTEDPQQGRRRLAAHKVELAEDQSPGLLIRFTPLS